MDTSLLESLLNDPQGIKVLSTCNGVGAPNVAVFGSARLLEDGHVRFGLSDNRSWENLRVNRRAVLMVFKPAEQVLAWQGVRAYLTLDEVVEAGPVLEGVRTEVEQQAGTMAARMVKRVVRFRIDMLRPLIDMQAM